MAKNIIPLDAPSKELFLLDEEDKRSIVDDVLSDIESVRDYFEALYTEGEENVRFYKNEQWTQEERNAHFQQNRHPYEINEVHSKINHLVGTQTNTKLDAKAQGRDRMDSKQAEVLTALIKWVEQMNDLDTVQREVFRQSLLRGASAAVVRFEFQDVNYGYPVVERVPIYELFWDLNARKVDLTDARWMARVMVKSRAELLEQFPEKKELIDDLPGYEANINNTYYGFRPGHVQQYIGYSDPGRHRREMLEVVEHYEKIVTYRYIVIDDVEGTEFVFEDEEEAQEYYDFLIQKYEDFKVEIYYPDLSPKVCLNIISRDSFIQTFTCNNDVIHRQMTALPRFPWIVNFCYFEDGDFWSFASYLKDPQRLINRSISTWDYQLGKAIQNLTTVNMAFFPRDVDYSSVVQQLSKTNPVLRVLDHRAIQLHPSQGAQAELFQNVNFAIQRMQEYAGGRNSLGLQESAAESGRAVLARSEQAGIGKLPLFDNLRIWRLSVTELIVWYIKNFMPNQQIIQIIGNDDAIEFVPLDDGIMETIEEQRYNLIVTEAQDSDSIRVEQFEQLVKMASQIQLPQDIMTEILIDLSSLPESTKQKIKERMPFYQEWQAKKQQEAEDQKMQKMVEEGIKRKQMRDSMLEGESQGQKAENLKEEDKLRIALEDNQNMQMQMAQNNLSPEEKDKLYSQVREPGEVQQAQAASMLGGLGIR